LKPSCGKPDLGIDEDTFGVYGFYTNFSFETEFTPDGDVKILEGSQEIKFIDIDISDFDNKLGR